MKPKKEHKYLASWEPLTPGREPELPETRVLLTMEDQILEVIEEIVGRTGVRRYFWYYNITSGMRSTCGRRGDFPDKKMSIVEAAWISVYRLPAAQAIDESLNRSKA